MDPEKEAGLIRKNYTQMACPYANPKAGLFFTLYIYCSMKPK